MVEEGGKERRWREREAERDGWKVEGSFSRN